MSADSIFLEGSGCECDVSLDTWLRDALPQVPGIVRSVAARELVLACREFYERSLSWRTTIGPVHARSRFLQYYQSPYDDYTNVVAVLGVEWKGRPLKKLVRQPTLDWESSDPTHYWITDVPDAVGLWPKLRADTDNALHFHVALTPKQSVDHLPRIAAIKHYDAILDGFLARVWSHPSKPYSNPAEAERRRTRFVAAIARYSGEAKTGYAAAQNWSFPRFGR